VPFIRAWNRFTVAAVLADILGDLLDPEEVRAEVVNRRCSGDDRLEPEELLIDLAEQLHGLSRRRDGRERRKERGAACRGRPRRIVGRHLKGERARRRCAGHTGDVEKRQKRADKSARVYACRSGL
jgi:hypothetical protein